MKKTLLVTISILAAISAAFIGCGGTNIPDEITLQVPALPGPANLKAEKYTGLVRLTWNPVYDATEYEVWRSSSDDSSTKKLVTISQGEVTQWNDYITVNNVLENNKTYQYTVVALSAKSTRAVEDTVQNGKSSISVKTDKDQFPEAGTQIAPDITDVAVTDLGNGLFKVDWTAGDWAKGAYTLYQVKLYDQNASVSGQYWTANTSTVVASDTAITVQAISGTNYYPSGALKYENLPVTIDASLSNITLSASRDSSKNVLLSFTNKNDVSYTIYKTKVENNVAFDWKEVSTAGKVLIGNNWQVTDAPIPTTETWIYRLIARNSAGEIWISSISTSVNADAMPALNDLNANFHWLYSTPSPADDDYDDTTAKLIVRFDTTPNVAGVTYTFFRKKYGDADGTGSTLGDWEPLTVTPVFGTYDSAYIEYTPPEKRQKYYYKLTATKDGYKGKEDKLESGTLAPKSSAVDLTINNNFKYSLVATNYGASSTTEKSYIYSFNINTSKLIKNERIILLGKKKIADDNTVDGNWVEVTTWTKQEAGSYYGKNMATAIPLDKGFYYTLPLDEKKHELNYFYSDFKIVLDNPQ